VFENITHGMRSGQKAGEAQLLEDPLHTACQGVPPHCQRAEPDPLPFNDASNQPASVHVPFCRFRI
jgi:hypothetical protein